MAIWKPSISVEKNRLWPSSEKSAIFSAVPHFLPRGAKIPVDKFSVQNRETGRDLAFDPWLEDLSCDSHGEGGVSDLPRLPDNSS